MIKVLVTGGAGYIGSVLVGSLLSRGYQVTVVDNLIHKNLSLFNYCSNDNFLFVRGDSRNDQLMRELLKGIDIIIPLAAIVGAKACDRDPHLTRTTNFDSIALINQLRSPQQRVIFPCTNSGYGTQSGDIYCTEETPMEPITLYGKTKVDAERELLNSPNVITLRLATVFGVSPRMRLDLLVNDFVYKAMNDGYLVIYEPHFKRNYVHIEDVADCFCYCIEHFEEMKGEPYNLGLDEANLSKEELAQKVKEYIPKLYIHFAKIGSDPDKRNYIVSNKKIRQKGFAAQRGLDDGIRHLMKAYSMITNSNLYNA